MVQYSFKGSRKKHIVIAWKLRKENVKKRKKCFLKESIGLPERAVLCNINNKAISARRYLGQEWRELLIEAPNKEKTKPFTMILFGTSKVSLPSENRWKVWFTQLDILKRPFFLSWKFR